MILLVVADLGRGKLEQVLKELWGDSFLLFCPGGVVFHGFEEFFEFLLKANGPSTAVEGSEVSYRWVKGRPPVTFPERRSQSPCGLFNSFSRHRFTTVSNNLPRLGRELSISIYLEENLKGKVGFVIGYSIKSGVTSCEVVGAEGLPPTPDPFPSLLT